MQFGKERVEPAESISCDLSNQRIILPRLSRLVPACRAWLKFYNRNRYRSEQSLFASAFLHDSAAPW